MADVKYLGKCGTCKFWECQEDEIDPLIYGGTLGNCHRLPPSNHGDEQSYFPETMHLEWCGEYQPNEAASEAADKDSKDSDRSSR